MKHEGSRQIGGYHNSNDPPTKATSVRKHAHAPTRRPKAPEGHNAEFHRVLGQLRNALWNNDHERIPNLERRIDHIVRQWEADN